MIKLLIGSVVLAGALGASPAFAGTVFLSDFENVAGAPAPWNYSIVGSADGWTGLPQIELQNHVAGSPAPSGGNIFVELDADYNSAMERTIAAAGNYTLSFLYSPRPYVVAASNGIDVLLNGVALAPTYTADGPGDTLWSTQTLSFTAAAGSTLTFKAVGTSDAQGGYLDNIELSTGAVPEPATWAMMLLGAGVLGSALRRRQALTLRYA